MHNDLTGKMFGRWAVLGFAGRDARGKDRWLCRCSCGMEKTVRGDQLKAGYSKSCGCLSREVAAGVARKTGLANVKHGGEGTPLYSVWHRMKERCLNPHHQAYARYGGRGIKICDAWLDDFAAFRAWAVSAGYRSGLTLDRVNNDDGYSPDNCRWATRKEQSRNRRVCVYIRGRCIAEWAEGAKVSESAVRQRLARGWSIEDACEIPAGGRRDAP